MKTTVIIPAYNHMRTVRASVLSILSADPGQVKVIAIDDGSTDRTLEVLRSMELEFPEIVQVYTHTNRGICGTLNRGVGLVDTPFVAFLASDDERIEGSIMAQRRQLAELPDEFGACYGPAIFTFYDTSGALTKQQQVSYRPHNARQPEFLNLLRRNEYIPLQCCLYRTDAVRKAGDFDESLSFEDRDFQLRFSLDYRFHYDERPVCYYRTEEGHTSLDDKVYQYAAEYMRIIDKHVAAPDVLAQPDPEEFIRNIRGQEYAFIADKSFSRGEYDFARQMYRKARMNGFQTFRVRSRQLWSRPEFTGRIPAARALDWVSLRVHRRLSNLVSRLPL